MPPPLRTDVAGPEVEDNARGEYRVWGPPGTGKTTFLAKEIQRAVSRRGPDAVLVASHTKAAATEIAGRKIQLPRERVGTLHSFCYRALGRPEVAESPKWIRAWNEQAPAHLRLYGAASDPEESAAVAAVDDAESMRRGDSDRVLEAWGRERMSLGRVHADPALAVAMRAFVPKWEEWKKANELVDFADMVLRCMDAPPPLPAEVIFIDEAQDLTPAQIRLVRSWEKHCEFFVMAGDDDQTIHGFAGADPYELISRDLPPNHDIVLTQSHRLPKSVKDYADCLIGGTLGMRVPKKFDPRADGARGRVVIPDGTSRSPSATVDAAIEEQGTVMFLASHAAALLQTIRVLRERGVPFWNPYRTTNGRWNPLRGGAERLGAFLRTQASVWGARARSWSWKDLWRWVEILDAKKAGLKSGAKTAVETKAKDKNRCQHVVSPTEASEVLGITIPMGDAAWLKSRLTASAASSGMLDYASAVYARNPTGLSEVPRVVVGSVHSTKGAEADRVVLYPDLSPAALYSLDGGAAASDAVRRLFYVGATRARETLMVPSPSRGSQGFPLDSAGQGWS